MSYCNGNGEWSVMGCDNQPSICSKHAQARVRAAQEKEWARIEVLKQKLTDIAGATTDYLTDDLTPKAALTKIMEILDRKEQ